MEAEFRHGKPYSPNVQGQVHRLCLTALWRWSLSESCLRCLQVERFNRTIKALTYSTMHGQGLMADWTQALAKATYFYNYRKQVPFISRCVLLAFRCSLVLALPAQNY